MTKTCGKEFGLCKLQINSEISFGGIVETLYHQRKIWFDVPSSPVFLGYPEDPLHALWTCTKLDVVWADSELWDFRSQTHFQDFKKLTAWVLKHAKNPNLFATITWAIWNQRNHIRLHQVLHHRPTILGIQGSLWGIQGHFSSTYT